MSPRRARSGQRAAPEEVLPDVGVEELRALLEEGEGVPPLEEADADLLGTAGGGPGVGALKHDLLRDRPGRRGVRQRRHPQALAHTRDAVHRGVQRLPHVEVPANAHGLRHAVGAARAPRRRQPALEQRAALLRVGLEEHRGPVAVPAWQRLPGEEVVVRPAHDAAGAALAQQPLPLLRHVGLHELRLAADHRVAHADEARADHRRRDEVPGALHHQRRDLAPEVQCAAAGAAGRARDHGCWAQVADASVA
mmetsp:Transcript_30541/g.87260  ORF Transcript_30541/g.87260 Transcript_30541/m.87260 type:complete len:251 (+) Transcript_30541:360-1112(+)